MQRRSVWCVLCVICVVLSEVSCSEDSAEEQAADTQASDTADAVEDSIPACPSGERADGVCAPLPPAKPMFADWVCPAGWLSVPALATVSGEPIAIEGVAPWMRCEPPPFVEPPSECGPGLMPQYGQAACVAHGSACPPDGEDWTDDSALHALAPDFAGRIWFVRAGEASGGTGTRDAPFGTLEVALRASNGGDIIALSKGEFAESFSVARPVAVVGACVTGTTIHPPGPDDTVPSVAVSGSALLKNFTITGPRIGLQIDANDAPATAQDILIRSAEQRGVLVNSGGKLTLSQVWVDDTQADAVTQFSGEGLVAWSETQVEISGSVFTRNKSGCIHAEGQITLTDALVMQTRPRQTDNYFGGGITVVEGCQATLTRVAMLDNFAFGLAAEDATVTLKDVQVFRTQKHPSNAYDSKGLLLKSSKSELEAVSVFRNFGTGLEARGGTLSVTGLRISDTQAIGYGQAPGLFLWGGVRAEMEGAALSGDVSVAVSVRGDDLEATTATVATFQDLWISDTASALSPEGSFDGGTALNVYDGTQATVSRAVLLNNPGAGVAVNGRGTVLELSDAVVFGTRGDTTKGIENIDASGTGLRIFTRPEDEGTSKAEVTLRRVSLSQNQSFGVFAYGDVELVMEDVEVSDTQQRQIEPDAQPEYGYGVALLGELSATFARISLRRNHSVGLEVIELASLNASDIEIVGTRPHFDQRFGHGLQTRGQATVTMERVALKENAQLGAVITNESTLTWSDVLVSGDNDESCPQCEWRVGDGVVSEFKASLSMQRFKITDCPRVGLFLASDNVSASDGLITGNLIGLNITAKGIDVTRDLQNVVLTGNNVDQDFSQIALPNVSDAVESADALVGAPAVP